MSLVPAVTTCLAIALFGDEVSPRFCYAESILVVCLAKGREQRRQVLSLGEPWLPRRLAQLSAMGVRTLLCGAFNRAFLPNAKHLGIHVITGVSGKAEEALARYLGRRHRRSRAGPHRDASGLAVGEARRSRS